MKPLLIAVVLAAMQAHSPAPGTAANTPADDGKSVNKHTQNEKNPTAKTTPAREAAGTHVDQKTGDMAAADAHQAISIRELPPVSAKRDRIDWLALAFTGALVIVGALGVCYAIKTLKGIERQANANEGQLQEIQRAGEQTTKLIAHAEKQAEAALLNARAVINAERAWILVRMVPTGPYKRSRDLGPDRYEWEDGTPLSPEEVVSGRHLRPERIRYTMKNYGRSPGFVTSHWANVRIVGELNNLPNPPDYFTKPASIFIEKADFVVEPGGERKSDFFEPPGGIATRGSSFLYVYGIITYRDFFNQDHKTGFCFYYHVPSDRDLNPQGFYAEGPDGYNYQT